MNRETKLRGSLLAMRLAIFGVMLMWTLDKFLNPGHAVKVFENFYFLAAWPMLAGCLLLYLLRDEDTWCRLGKPS
ncbi:MAG: hypothetical protein ACU83V_08615 [Gammaproteobacteria bacterium]